METAAGSCGVRRGAGGNRVEQRRAAGAGACERLGACVRGGGCLLQRGDLLGVEPALAGEGVDERAALGLTCRERRCTRLRVAGGGGGHLGARRELLLQPGEPGSRGPRPRDQHPVLPGREAEAVDRLQRVLERVRGEDHRDRVGAALLVQRAEALLEAAMGRVGRAPRDPQRRGDRRALALERGDARLRRGELGVCAPHLRLECIELEHGGARPGRERLVGTTKPVGLVRRLRSRRGEREAAEGRDRGDRQGHRKSAVSTVHGAGH